MKGCGESTHVLGLIKGVYGLKDAPRAWRIKVDQILRSLDSNPMKSDPCLYMWHNKGGDLLAIASTHVDDLKLIGTEEQIALIIQGLEK